MSYANSFRIAEISNEPDNAVRRRSRCRRAVIEQHELVAILSRRLAEAARKQIALDVQEARQQFAQGKCQPATADELMREIMK
jgi:hypothetical protein